jgi:nitronate monooxygenase
VGLDAQYRQLVSAMRDRRLLDLFGIAAPIVQAPMAGAQDADLAIAAGKGGALGSLPCALLGIDAARDQIARFRVATDGPLNLNFFCHAAADSYDDAAWRAALAPYYAEYRVGYPATPPPLRKPFDAAMCALVEETRPKVVSFHFGLPSEPLLRRVRATDALILASATSPAEARWLADRGVDAVIAQGWEAGGHAGRFLPADPSSHMGTLALVPQVVDAVAVPVIAAGGIADARGIAAALMLGASAVQIGTAYLFTPEARISDIHRRRLAEPGAETTVSTNLFTGRFARGFETRLTRDLGPASTIVPPFPHGGDALADLRKADPGAFANMWAGQAARLGKPEGAEALTRRLAAEVLELLP